MARTAPVPNIPPIPGMNPGSWIMGGGGDGGGSGGKSGKGGSGKEGASGKTGGEEGEGGGKGAGNCGQGGAGGCTNCGSNTSAGDPVDVVSGEMFTLANEDLWLGGPIALSFLRQYHVARRGEDVGLGWGFSHSLSWRLEVQGRELIVKPPFARPRAFDRRAAESAAFSDGRYILSRRADGSYRLDTGDDFFHVFAPQDPEQTRFLFVAVEHANGHRIRLEYDSRGVLRAIFDSAGRTVRVDTDPHGRILALSCGDPATNQHITFARYAYDGAGHLLSHTDADGVTTRYGYDARKLVTSCSHASGLTFFFRYDAKQRCIETWGEYTAGHDPALAADVPQTLRDGRPAKGIYHTAFEYGEDGYSEVIDSERLLRFFADPSTGQIVKAVGADGGVTTREIDAFGNVIAHTDALGATTRYAWDVRGRLIRETDALGNTWYIVRDTAGRPIANEDPEGGLVECYRDARGNIETLVNQRGATITYRFDQFSQMTEMIDAVGGRYTYQGDAHFNLTECTFPDGGKWQWAWDYWGRLIQRTDPEGRVDRYRYSAAGRCVAHQHPDGQIVYYEYDAAGQCVAEVRATGTTQYRWGGFGWPCGATYPNGDSIHFRWNREGWCTELVNERGEVCTWRYSPAGYVVEERAFDGSLTRITYDELGRATSWENGHGKIFLERDSIGRVTNVTWPDESVETYAYNRRGEHVAAAGPAARVSFERDPVGNCTRETQTVGEETEWLEYSYDLSDRLVARNTSLGFHEVIQRDACGRATATELDGATTVRFERDRLGMLTGRLLPGGARTTFEYDAGYRLSRMALLPAIAPTRAGGLERPARVGAAPFPEAFHKAYRYSPGGDLTFASSSDGGTTTYDYDVRHRLLARETDRGERELFGVDPAGNVFERQAQRLRQYGAGNRLLQKDAARYVYDDAGYLIEKLFSEGEREPRLRLEWNGQQQLGVVVTPDGTRVECDYDPYGRRLEKRVYRPTLLGDLLLSTRSRFVWSSNQLIHEVERATGNAARRERTYVFDDNRFNPYAHRESWRDTAGVRHGPWIFYLTDILGVPERFIDGTGQLLGSMSHSAFGLTDEPGDRALATPFRFPGQYADAETGLHYNRFRYYDPDASRFISPDPLGPEVGLNLYQYGPNPVGFIDPLGLASHAATCSVTTDGGETFVPTPPPSNRIGRGPGFRSTQGHTIPSATRVRPESPPMAIQPQPGGLTANSSSRYAHSEQNALEWAEQTLGPRGLLPNSHMHLGGQRPPCPRCHRAMQEFAAKNNCKISYNYPRGNSVTYDGSQCKNGVPARAPITDVKGQQYHKDLMSKYGALEKQGCFFGDSPAMAKRAGRPFQPGDPDTGVTDAYNRASAQQDQKGDRSRAAMRDHNRAGNDPNVPP